LQAGYAGRAQQRRRGSERATEPALGPIAGFLFKHFAGCTPAYRKRMIIGDKFDPDHLDVNNHQPPGGGGLRASAVR
jgi:hypothetical protein